MTKARLLTIGLAIQLVFFSGWAVWLMFGDRALAEVWLETEPVDPRDLLSGHYVALSYKISRPSWYNCGPFVAADAAQLYVRLDQQSRRVDTERGWHNIWEAQVCNDKPGKRAEVWAKADIVKAGWRGPTLHYGIERFYVNEHSPLREAAAGSVIARVTLRRGGALRLEELVKLRAPERPAPARR